MIHNAYVDIDGVTEQPGPNCKNWIEITKLKLQERESKLLQVIKDKIESIVNETLNVNTSHPIALTISDGIINGTLSVLANSINQWNGVHLCRLKKPPALYRDYYHVSKKSWDRRKTKLFGSALWVNVFKQLQQLVWMNMRTLIQILHALFCATIKYSNTKAQSLICGTVIRESREFQTYFMTLHDSFRIAEWITAFDKKHVAKSLLQKMQSHLIFILDHEFVVDGRGRMDEEEKEPQMDDCHYYPQTRATSIVAPLPSHMQPQPQNFVVNPSVGSGSGGGRGGARMDSNMQQMDVDGNNGRKVYNVNTHQQPPQPLIPMNGSNDMMVMQPYTYNSCNYYSNHNQYPPDVENSNTYNSGHCCCCSCNRNGERLMNVTNGNYNTANPSLCGYSSSVNVNGNGFRDRYSSASFTQGFRSQSLSNSPYSYAPSTSLNSQTERVPAPSNTNMHRTTSSTLYGFNAPTPPTVYNRTIHNNNNDMFYEDTLNEMNTFEMNDYDFTPLPADTWL